MIIATLQQANYQGIAIPSTDVAYRYTRLSIFTTFTIPARKIAAEGTVSTKNDGENFHIDSGR